MRHVANSAAILGAAASLTAALACAAPPPAADAGEPKFREIYRELVETNTALSAGSCTLAAQRMAARLKAAGFSDDELHPFEAPDHPKEGGLVAVYGGRDPKLKAVLLLAHIDVVEAKREDWTRDPFTLVEENGNFYARGAIDDKAEAAIWVDTLARLRQEHFRPRRTLKLALTCGEETAGAFNGAEWLVNNRRDLIDAAFAINEGAFGELSADGSRIALEVQAGEKTCAELPAGGDQSGRPQFASREEQRHLPSGRSAHEDRGLRVPGAVHGRQSRLLRGNGEDRGRQGATPMPPPR